MSSIHVNQLASYLKPLSQPHAYFAGEANEL